MTTTYFRTRDLAKAGVKELNGSFKDFGSTAPKGERWAVLVEVPEVPKSSQELVESMDESIAKTQKYLAHQLLVQDAAKIAKQPAGIEHQEVLSTPNNKKCLVSWRRKRPVHSA